MLEKYKEQKKVMKNEKWQKKEARAKTRNFDDSGRNRIPKSKKKGLGETQRTTEDKWYSPKSRADWNL